MTARELIAILEQQHPDMLIVVDGYESGYNELKKTEYVAIEKNPGAECWDGDYERVPFNTKGSVRALCLSRSKSE